MPAITSRFATWISAPRLVARMEVRRRAVAVVHLDHEPVRRADPGHGGDDVAPYGWWGGRSGFPGQRSAAPARRPASEALARLPLRTDGLAGASDPSSTPRDTAPPGLPIGPSAALSAAQTAWPLLHTCTLRWEGRRSAAANGCDHAPAMLVSHLGEVLVEDRGSGRCWRRSVSRMPPRRGAGLEVAPLK